MEPGLARVMDHILAFEHNEFYFKAWPALIRRKFADVCFMFEDAVPFGLKLANPTADGTLILINPPGDQVIEDGDMLIVIAEDDDTYSPGELQLVDAKDYPKTAASDEIATPKNILIVGFRPDLANMLKELEKWVPKGSKTLLFNSVDIDTRNDELYDHGLAIEEFENLTIYHMEGSPLLKADLEKIGEKDKYGVDHGTTFDGEPNQIPFIHEFGSSIILAEQHKADDGTVENSLEADSRVLISSIVIRALQREKKFGADRPPGPVGSSFTLVGEILDPRTLNLIKASKLNDFVCINDVVSMALAQITQQPLVLDLLDEMFRPDGSELHIKEIELYAHEGEALNWWELVARARLRAEIALGYIKQSESVYVLPVLNPPDKKQKITWHHWDKLVVFSEE